MSLHQIPNVLFSALRNAPRMSAVANFSLGMGRLGFSGFGFQAPFACGELHFHIISAIQQISDVMTLFGDSRIVTITEDFTAQNFGAEKALQRCQLTLFFQHVLSTKVSHWVLLKQE